MPSMDAAHREAEHMLGEARSADSSCLSDPVVQNARLLGPALFPLIPDDVHRGLDVEWSAKGIEFDPRHEFIGGSLQQQGDGAIYWNATRRAAAANEVAIRVARGESIHVICGDGRDPSQVPDESTYYRWMFGVGDEYVQRCHQLARQMRAEGFADQIVEIADRASQSSDMAEVQGHRLAVETRQWLMSKVMPRLYGQKGDGAAAVTINVSTNLDGQDRQSDNDGAFRARVTVDNPENQS